MYVNLSADEDGIVSRHIKSNCNIVKLETYKNYFYSHSWQKTCRTFEH